MVFNIKIAFLAIAFSFTLMSFSSDANQPPQNLGQANTVELIHSSNDAITPDTRIPRTVIIVGRVVVQAVRRNVRILGTAVETPLVWGAKQHDHKLDAKIRMRDLD